MVDQNQIELLAETLGVAVRQLAENRSGRQFLKEPVITERLITEFNQRMRIDVMEKFNSPTVCSAIHFYLDEDDLKNGYTPYGVIVLFVEVNYIPELMRKFGYPVIDDESSEEMEDACGTLANIIGGAFKKEALEAGFPELEMGPFESYTNSVVNGINYPTSENIKYEIEFRDNDKKRVVLEVAFREFVQEEYI